MTFEELIIDAITVGSVAHIPLSVVDPSRIFYRMVQHSKKKFNPINTLHNVIVFKKYCERNNLEFDFTLLNEGLINRFNGETSIFLLSFIRVTLAFINPQPSLIIRAIIHYSKDFSKVGDGKYTEFYDAIIEGVVSKKMKKYYSFTFSLSESKTQVITDTCGITEKTLPLIVKRLKKLAITHPVYVMFVCLSFRNYGLEEAFKKSLSNYLKRKPKTREILDNIQQLLM